MWCVLPLDLMGYRWSKQPSRIDLTGVRCGGWHQSLQIGEGQNFKADRIFFHLRRQRALSLWKIVSKIRILWTTRKSNQLFLKEINSEYSLEGLLLMLKLNLKVQYFGHLLEELTHWKRPWCWKISTAKWEGDNRGWDG